MSNNIDPEYCKQDQLIYIYFLSLFWSIKSISQVENVVFCWFEGCNNGRILEQFKNWTVDSWENRNGRRCKDKGKIFYWKSGMENSEFPYSESALAFLRY